MFQYPELNFTNRDRAEFPETLSFGMVLIDFTSIAHPSLAGDRHPQLLRQQRTALHFEQLHKLYCGLYTWNNAAEHILLPQSSIYLQVDGGRRFLTGLQ